MCISWVPTLIIPNNVQSVLFFFLATNIYVCQNIKLKKINLENGFWLPLLELKWCHNSALVQLSIKNQVEGVSIQP